jgi:mono/diheme cytochrome c family protein
MAKVAQQGVMQNAKWVEHREINDHNLAAAGREVFNLLCSSCHSVGGPLHDIKELTARSSPAEMDLIITTMGTQRPYMPPFIGTEKEKKALYHFLFTTLHGKQVAEKH